MASGEETTSGSDMLGLVCLVASTNIAERSHVQSRLSLLTANTLVDTVISDRVGSCHISLVRPAMSECMYLHLTLNGCGTRYVTRKAVDTLSDAILAHSTVDITCVVRMSESHGASLLALPAVTQFLLAHRKRMIRVSVLEARGLALNAVRTVMRINNHRPHINLYHSWAEFECACVASHDERDQFALRLDIRQAARRRVRWPPPMLLGRWVKGLAE